MNIYLLDAGIQREAVYEDHENNVGHWEYSDAIGLYAAETRGKAKAMFCTEFDIDWTEQVAIKLVQKDYDTTAGAVFDPILWIQAHAMTSPDLDADEFYQWQYVFEYDEAMINDQH